MTGRVERQRKAVREAAGRGAKQGALNGEEPPMDEQLKGWRGRSVRVCAEYKGNCEQVACVRPASPTHLAENSPSDEPPTGAPSSAVTQSPGCSRPPAPAATAVITRAPSLASSVTGQSPGPAHASSVTESSTVFFTSRVTICGGGGLVPSSDIAAMTEAPRDAAETLPATAASPGPWAVGIKLRGTKGSANCTANTLRSEVGQGGRGGLTTRACCVCAGGWDQLRSHGR